ncbi:hypothetical protein BDR05DRAFT_959502, partial [Suillus weaverae]
EVVLVQDTSQQTAQEPTQDAENIFTGRDLRELQGRLLAATNNTIRCAVA